MRMELQKVADFAAMRANMDLARLRRRRAKVTPEAIYASKRSFVESSVCVGNSMRRNSGILWANPLFNMPDLTRANLLAPAP